MSKKFYVAPLGVDEWYEVPAQSSGFTIESNTVDDSIFGTFFQSNQSTLLDWETEASGIYKSVPGYKASLRKAGSSTPFAEEPTTLVNGWYEIDNKLRGIWDRTQPINVRDGSGDVNYHLDTIDYLFGRVKFKDSYSPSGDVTVTGRYISTVEICGARSYTLTQSADTENVTTFCTAKEDDGFSDYKAQRLTVSLNVEGFYNPNGQFNDDIAGREEYLLELVMSDSGKSLARGYFGITGVTLSSDVGNVEIRSVNYELVVPEGITRPFSWYHAEDTEMSKALRVIVDAWLNREEMRIRYALNTGFYYFGQVVVVDSSLENSVDDITRFSFNFQGSGKLNSWSYKDQLIQSINFAKSFNPNAYTIETWQVVEEAVGVGERLVADPNASVEDVDNATQDINVAIDNLVKWTPKELFKNGEKGIWFSPKDMSSLYQDSAGITPVTDIGQPVGLMLDKSQGMELGPEQCPDPNMQDPGAWLSGGGYIHGGVADLDNSDGSAWITLGANMGFVPGKTYAVTLVVDSINGSSPADALRLTDNGSLLYVIVPTPGEFKAVIVARDSRLLFRVRPGNGVVISFASVRELKGHHAMQPTTSMKPTYTRRKDSFGLEHDTVDDVIPFSVPDYTGYICVAGLFRGSPINRNYNTLRAGSGTGPFVLIGERDRNSYPNADIAGGTSIRSRVNGSHFNGRRADMYELWTNPAKNIMCVAERVVPKGSPVWSDEAQILVYGTARPGGILYEYIEVEGDSFGDNLPRVEYYLSQLLVEIPPKEKLEFQLQRFNGLIGEDYTLGSWDIMATSGAHGQAVYNDPTSSDNEMLNAANAMEDAYKALVEWTPEILFQNGRKGVWFSPRDMTTLYQDSQGNTKVTGSGQPIGLMLDKSQGMGLGPELYNNSIQWTVSAPSSVDYGEFEWDIGNKVLEVTKAGTSPGYPRVQVILPEVEVGKTYKVSGLVISENGARLATVRLATGGAEHDIFYDRTTGIYAGAQVAGNSVLEFSVDSRNTGKFTFIIGSVRELKGHHAMQPTTSMKPTLQVSDDVYGVVFDAVDDLLPWPRPQYQGRISIGVGIYTGATTPARAWRGMAGSTLRVMYVAGTEAGREALVSSPLSPSVMRINGESFTGTTGGELYDLVRDTIYYGVVENYNGQGWEGEFVQNVQYSTGRNGGTLYEYIEVEGDSFGDDLTRVERYLKKVIGKH